MRWGAAITAGLCLCGAAYARSRPACAPISDRAMGRLTAYVRQRYKLAPRIQLSLDPQEPAGAGCYRRLTFHVRSPLRAFDIILYLSPDQRYLFPALFDSTLDPAVEQRRRDEAVMRGLTERPGPTLGPPGAPVTIVEFSDFECPFCRRLASIEKQVLPRFNGRVRVIFKNYPLSIHPWAQEAAEAATCAYFQSPPGFWLFHDYFFSH